MESSAAVEEGEERLSKQRAAKQQRERERRASEYLDCPAVVEDVRPSVRVTLKRV